MLSFQKEDMFYSSTADLDSTAALLPSLGDPVTPLQLSCWHTWLRSCSSPGTSSEIHDYSQQGHKAIVVPANLGTPKPLKKT